MVTLLNCQIVTWLIEVKAKVEAEKEHGQMVKLLHCQIVKLLNC